MHKGQSYRARFLGLSIAATWIGVACQPQSFAREDLPEKIVLSTPSAAATNPPPVSKSVCDQPRKSLHNNPAFIINGTREPTLLPMSSAQKLAVVSIADRNGASFCTGTLIAGRYVLTAKHCTVDSSASQIWVQLSVDGSQIVWRSAVSQLWEHDSGDLSVLQLSEDAVAATGASPIVPNSTGIDSAWVDQRVEVGGFGAIDLQGRQDGRFFVAEPIADVARTMLTINGEGYHGVCFGDSGGPVMAVVDNQLRVLGALSNGDASCTGYDNYTRTDAYFDWVSDIAGPFASATSACGDLSSTGYCGDSDSRALYCDQGQVRQDSCAPGQACGWDEEQQGYRCVEVDPCQGVDSLGRCDGDSVLWCADGALQRFDCAACGWTCDWASDATGFDCVQIIDSTPPVLDQGSAADDGADDPAPTPVTASDPCDSLDYQGRCDGSVAEWCNGGEYHAVDCAGQGAICDFVDDETGYFCAQVPSADPCADLDYLGRCDGAVTEWCSGGEYHSVDCGDYGYACGYTGASYGYYCVNN